MVNTLMNIFSGNAITTALHRISSAASISNKNMMEGIYMPAFGSRSGLPKWGLVCSVERVLTPYS